jgi:hypothetical protein
MEQWHINMLNILILSFGIAVLILGIFGGIGAFVVLGKINVRSEEHEVKIPIEVKNAPRKEVEPDVPFCPTDEEDPSVKTISTDELMKMVSKEENGN